MHSIKVHAYIFVHVQHLFFFNVCLFLHIFIHLFIQSLSNIYSEICCLLAELVKSLPAMQETLVQFLGLEEPLEKG